MYVHFTVAEFKAALDKYYPATGYTATLTPEYCRFLHMWYSNPAQIKLYNLTNINHVEHVAIHFLLNTFAGTVLYLPMGVVAPAQIANSCLPAVWEALTAENFTALKPENVFTTCMPPARLAEELTELINCFITRYRKSKE